MPGSGKTTTGKKIANKYKMDFIDADSYIEEKFRMSIKQIFSKIGEEGFRKLEKKVLDEILQKNNTIFATGGGMPCFFDNMEKMNKKGITIYLNIPEGIIAHRLIHSKKTRPLIQNMTEEEVKQYVNSTLQKRNPYFEKAQFSIDTSKEKIFNLIEEKIFNFNIPKNQ